MSFVPNGGSNKFIGNGVTQGWVFTWDSAGWQGNTFFEGQPFNTGAALSSAVGSAHLNSNGTFSFSFSITNHGPNSTFYNIQASDN
jgi:hypothetical protein